MTHKISILSECYPEAFLQINFSKNIFYIYNLPIKWHQFLMCSHIYNLLIERDICDCRNVSIKFPCIYLWLSSRDLLVFSVRVSFFYSCFCIIFLHYSLNYSKCTTLLEKYLTFFFCENLVNCNEACLHEATLNLHRHTSIFLPPVNSISWWQAAFERSSV